MYASLGDKWCVENVLPHVNTHVLAFEILSMRHMLDL
jgi:hypothetical protein